MLSYSGNLLFCTLLVPKRRQPAGDWWYFGPEHGQHIAFYTVPALQVVAERFNLHLSTDGAGTHLLSQKPVPGRLFRFFARETLATLIVRRLLRRRMRKHSLLKDDFQAVSGYALWGPVPTKPLLNKARSPQCAYQQRKCVDLLWGRFAHRWSAGDPGFAGLMHRTETHGMPGRLRRTLLRRFRKERTTATPSPASVFRYLSAFHDPNGSADRQPHKAFIPAAGEHLRGLARVNVDVVLFVQRHSPHKHATLDQDATLVATHKADALFFRTNIFAGISRSTILCRA
jgi:hypothetical protein